jgi:hypothetical protein
MEKPNKKMLAVASERLGVSEHDVAAAFRPAPGFDQGGFFAVPGRGGGRLLVSADGEALWASSSLAPAAHVEAFLKGRRN